MAHPKASLRASHITGGSQSQAPSAAALARLSEKKKEYDAVCALDRASAMFVKRIEGLSADCDVMADAGIVHGQVLAQWPQMFKILETFLSTREQIREDDEDVPAPPAGERLVRVPMDELQPENQR